MKEGEEISGDDNTGLAPLLQNLSYLLDKVAFLHSVCKRKLELKTSWVINIPTFVFPSQSMISCNSVITLKQKLIVLSDISLVIFINWSK